MPDATRKLIRVRYAAGSILRALAGEYGVSHETIRTIVCAGYEGDGEASGHPRHVPGSSEREHVR
jgi:hypothetical protein